MKSETDHTHLIVYMCRLLHCFGALVHAREERGRDKLRCTAITVIAEVKCGHIWPPSGVADKIFHGRIWPLSGVMG